jgi:2-keto-3-deoxy-L-rhamnonate aldolase RhmA
MISLRHASPTLAAYVATLGFDLVFVDLEHGRLGIETADLIVRMVRANDGAAIIRSSSGSDEALRRALDLDVAGVIVPNVSDGEESARIAATFRAMRSAEERALLIPMIESPQAIRALDGIMAPAEVDALFIGPADLAQSLGHRGAPQHPAVRAAADKVVTRAAAAQRSVGVPLSYRDLPGFGGRGPGFLYYDLNAVIQAGAAATLKA